MVLQLYCWDPSAPTRAVYLCCNALGLKPEKKIVNLYNKEQYNEEYVKLNPQHTIPMINDDGTLIWDSHAICAYLVTVYGKDDSLYPKDPKIRALVDQRLHFDTGMIFPRILEIIVPLIWRKETNEIPESEQKRVLSVFDTLEKFLEIGDYVAGNKYTIADFCCVTSVSTLEGPLRISVDGHPRIKAWLQRCKDNLPGYKEAQEKGLAIFTQAVNAAMAQTTVTMSN